MLGMLSSLKNTVYKTKSDLNILSRYPAKETENRNVEPIPADLIPTSSWPFVNTLALL